MSKPGLLLLFVMLIASTQLLTPFALADTVTVDPTTAFQSRTDGGWITFTITLTPTYVETTGNFTTFYAPTTLLTAVGIDAPAGANVSVTSLTDWDLGYTTTQTGSKTVRFYLPNTDPPIVTGADSSSYDEDTDILSVITASSTTVNISWEDVIPPSGIITWTNPTYPFYGSDGTGPIYFITSFTATGGNWIDGCVVFNNFNYGGSGVFGTIGYAADLGVTAIVLEVVPADHLLIQTATSSAKNITVYLPSNIPLNVTNEVAWTYTAPLLHITVPAGTYNIRVDFVEGSGTEPTVFYVPQWFIDQGGNFFGVANFFAQITAVLAAFVAWFVISVTNVVSLIFYIMTAIVYVASTVIYWFGRMVLLFISIGNIIGSLMDGTNSLSTGLGNIWTLIGYASWIDFIPVLAFMLWFDSLYPRCKKTGKGLHEVVIGDIQIVMYVVEQVWSWSFLVFNTVYGIIMQFIGLLWGLV